MTIKEYLERINEEIARGELTGKEEVWTENRFGLNKDVDGCYWSEDDYGNKILIMR